MEPMYALCDAAGCVMSESATREFHVTGTWDEPQVERVARAAEPVPQT